jgi:branched-chain amino acid transport system ATP-binding protein
MSDIGHNEPLLEIENLVVSYYKKEILRGVSMVVLAGEIVTLVGLNGSGKSTLMKAVAGIVRPKSGRIRLDGIDITSKQPQELARMGLGYLMQGNNVFPNLTVLEHLHLAAQAGGLRGHDLGAEKVWELFPALASSRHRRGGVLSGGERQMLAFSMLLVQKAKFWLLDEPSLGVSPQLVESLLGTVKELSVREGVTVLLVEQNIRGGLKISDRTYVLKNSTALREHLPSEILDQDNLEDIFF